MVAINVVFVFPPILFIFSKQKKKRVKVAPAVTRTVRATHKCYVRKESEKNKKRQNEKIALRMR